MLIRTLATLLLIAGSVLPGPWESPLLITRSADGVWFEPAAVFQDSSGVPSVVRWKGDTLACVFQWCRLPMGGPTWDRVAVKFSYDCGFTWTVPQVIVINGMPPAFQRPFDPTLAVTPGDSLRIYYSSSNGMPPPGGDSIIDTYSAVSADGICYAFDPGPRVNHPTNRVIDPAVIWFHGAWHYASPIGAPQDGAYHYVSPDGLNFGRVPDIPSDPSHNWTGNFVVSDTNDLRFYGCGPDIWFNSSPDGGTWTGYRPTNVRGGDPSVVRLGASDYLMVYVGQRYAGFGDPNVHQLPPASAAFARNVLFLHPSLTSVVSSYLLDISGRTVMALGPGSNDISRLGAGVYFLVERTATGEERVENKVLVLP